MEPDINECLRLAREREIELYNENKKLTARISTLEEALKMRPVVLAFAQQMEETLKLNDHKGGWEKCTPQWLLKRLRMEVEELFDAMEQSVEGNDCVIHEAADIANFAMMIADKTNRLLEQREEET